MILMQDKEVSMRDFAEVTNILAKNDIILWADLGTLLGFVRDGGFIPWEQDIDVGCFQTPEDFEKAEADLLKNGWMCFPKYGGVSIQNTKRTSKIDIKFYDEEEKHVKAKFSIRNNKKVIPICDFLLWIFNLYPPEFKYETNLSIDALRKIEKVVKVVPKTLRNLIVKLAEYVYYHQGLNGYVVRTRKDMVLPLKTMKVQGYEFHVPNQKEKYVENQYGKNWHIPMRMDGKEKYSRYFDGEKWVEVEEGMSRYFTQRMKDKSPDLVKRDEK